MLEETMILVHFFCFTLFWAKHEIIVKCPNVTVPDLENVYFIVEVSGFDIFYVEFSQLIVYGM